MSSRLPRRHRLRTVLRSEWAAVLAVAALGLTITGLGAKATSAVTGHNRRQLLERRAEQNRGLIDRRGASFAEVVHGLRGLFAASEVVSRREFRTFYDNERFAERYPGALAVSFARVVPAGQVASFEAAVRADTSLDGGGYPDFAVHPSGAADITYVVDYIEPMGSNQPALGFDLASEPARRVAVEEARDTGEAIATAPIRLVQDPAERPAVLLFLAVYDTDQLPVTGAARRRHFVGVATVAMRADDMLSAVLGTQRDVDVEVYDVGLIVEKGNVALRPENLVYDSNPSRRAVNARHRASVDLDLGTRRWRLVTASRPGLGTGLDRLAPAGVALGGGTVTLLLAALIHSFARSRRRAERLAEDMTADLRSRTAVLAEVHQELEERAVELERSNTELERSNAELERFAYIASHDLQEPLRMVSSFVGRLGERYADRLDERGQRYVEYAVDGAERMRALIDALLDYSRIGRAELHRQPTDLGPVVEEAAATLRPWVDETAAHLSVAPLPTVTVDGVLMRQLFQNLIANALKFRHPDRVPEVHVSATRSDAEWCVTVDDNGIGIEPKHRQRIFEVFKRLHSAAEYPGTGIGLAICLRIVEHHGGRIWVEDSPMGGSRFVFTVPALD
jgi:signal transduction histidine kinase